MKAHTAVVNVENGKLITTFYDTVDGEVVKVAEKGECKFEVGDYSVYVEKSKNVIDFLDKVITDTELCLMLHDNPEERSFQEDKLELLEKEKQSIEEAEEAKEVLIEYSNDTCVISYNGKRLKVEDTYELILRDVLITVINNKQKDFDKVETEDYVLLHKKGYLELLLNEKFLNKPVKMYLDDGACPEVIFKTSSLKKTSLVMKLPSDDMELDLDKLKNVLKVSKMFEDL